MPAFGAYPSSSSLWDALIEECQVVTSQNLLVEIMAEPLVVIRRDFNNGMNPYICRERYREWVRLVQDHLGAVDIPDWATLIQLEEDRWLFDYFSFLESEIPYEWEVFCDEEVPIHAAIAKLDVNATVDDFIELLLEVSPPNALIVYSATEYGAFYVMRSSDVEDRGPVGWNSYLPFHAVEDIADGSAEGDIPTFVLPPELVRAWKKAEEQNPTWNELRDFELENP